MHVKTKKATHVSQALKNELVATLTKEGWSGFVLLWDL